MKYIIFCGNEEISIAWGSIVFADEERPLAFFKFWMTGFITLARNLMDFCEYRNFLNFKFENCAFFKIRKVIKQIGNFQCGKMLKKLKVIFKFVLIFELWKKFQGWKIVKEEKIFKVEEICKFC